MTKAQDNWLFVFFMVLSLGGIAAVALGAQMPGITICGIAWGIALCRCIQNACAIFNDLNRKS